MFSNNNSSYFVACFIQTRFITLEIFTNKKMEFAEQASYFANPAFVVYPHKTCTTEAIANL